jgi:DsbC/DsbD-like thiol-disulfide interchange protein
MKFLNGVMAMVLAVAACSGARASSSGWYEMQGARVRLVTTGRVDAAGQLKGALDIQLNRGWKTYWRDPGDAGVPPTIDVSANGNIAKAEFDFPAPQRHDDGDYQWAGYDHPVALPVSFTFDGGTGPATISADIFLGVCETICVPVQATFTVDTSGDPENVEDKAVVAAAFDGLPEAATPDFGVTPAGQSDGGILLNATFPGDPTTAELFIAGEHGYVFGTPVRETRDGKTAFSVDVTRPDDTPSGPGLRYTLVTEAGAVSGLLPYL